MKRLQSILLGAAILLVAPAVFSSCQEDAPVINYTMNVTVTNDFSNVVGAIENGFLKNEDAIKKLIEAIDQMKGDQGGKLQALLEILNSMNTALDTKLALIEAAMKAQTLSLEGKLDLIVATINGLPDYSDKFDLVTAALDAMSAELEGLGEGQTAIATQIAAITAAINDLVAAVDSGRIDVADALSQIIQKLEDLKAAIESGGGSTPVFTSTVTLDGVTMPVLSAAIDKSDLEEGNWYDIYLFLSEDKKKYINIMADGKHHGGKTLDLTRKEDEHGGWYWAVEMRNPSRLFQTFGEPGLEYPVFLSGTLLVNRIGTGTEFEITLKNGKVKGEGMYGDGLEHTFSVDFKGELEFDEF